MKRNHPPDNPDELLDEQVIINERLNELFSHSSSELRQIPISQKGDWLSDRRHVRINSTKGLNTDLVSYSSELKYHFLKPYEALFSLESNHLKIFFNNFPLSLIEAYQVILVDQIDFRNYRVFQRLNRSGYICLQPNANLNKSPELPKREADGYTCTKIEHPQNPVETQYNFDPIFCIDSIKISFNSVLSSLRSLGPQDYEPLGDDELDKAVCTNTAISELGIDFHVYKRETYAKNKPRRGQPGTPDYHLIVCDKARQKPPSYKQLVQLDSSRAKAQDNSEIGKLLFALMDDDNSICFTLFEPASFPDSKTTSLFWQFVLKHKRYFYYFEDTVAVIVVRVI